MIRETISIDDAIVLLNSALECDRSAVSALVAARVPCNRGLAGHPAIQSGLRGGSGYEVGILGVLNGFFGTDERGWGPICAMVEADGSITKFERTARRAGTRS
jgi:hypothetical protein